MQEMSNIRVVNLEDINLKTCCSVPIFQELSSTTCTPTATEANSIRPLRQCKKPNYTRNNNKNPYKLGVSKVIFSIYEIF